jgi:hypothetical protein
MGVLRPVVQVPMLSMSNAGHHHWFRCAVAAQLVGDDHARSAPLARNSLLKKRIAAKRSRFRLYEDVEDNAVLIDGAR